MKKFIPMVCAFFMAGVIFADDNMPMMDDGDMMDDMPMMRDNSSDKNDDNGQSTGKSRFGRFERQAKFTKRGEKNNNFSRVRPGMGGMNFMGSERNKAEAQIQAKFPTEYAALEKERVALEEKFQALAKKAEVKLPLTYDDQVAKIEKFRNEHSQELLEINELRRTDPVAAMEKMKDLYTQAGIEIPFSGMIGRGGEMSRMKPDAENGKVAENGNRENPFAKISAELKLAFPAEYANLEKLRRENPREYRAEFQKLVKKLNDKRAAEPVVENKPDSVDNKGK